MWVRERTPTEVFWSNSSRHWEGLHLDLGQGGGRRIQEQDRVAFSESGSCKGVQCSLQWLRYTS